MSEATPFDRLDAILEQMLPKIDRAHLDALAAGFEEPTILVLDLRDGDARAIAELLLDAGLIARMLAGARRRRERPSLIIPLPRGLAGPCVATRSPELGSDVAATDAGEGYLAVVMAFGAAKVVEIRPLAAGPDPAPDGSPGVSSVPQMDRRSRRRPRSAFNMGLRTQ